jgi:hypothetical protein
MFNVTSPSAPSIVSPLTIGQKWSIVSALMKPPGDARQMRSNAFSASPMNSAIMGIAAQRAAQRGGNRPRGLFALPFLLNQLGSR